MQGRRDINANIWKCRPSTRFGLIVQTVFRAIHKSMLDNGLQLDQEVRLL